MKKEKMWFYREVNDEVEETVLKRIIERRPYAIVEDGEIQAKMEEHAKLIEQGETRAARISELVERLINGFDELKVYKEQAEEAQARIESSLEDYEMKFSSVVEGVDVLVGLYQEAKASAKESMRANDVRKLAEAKRRLCNLTDSGADTDIEELLASAEAQFFQLQNDNSELTKKLERMRRLLEKKEIAS